MPVMSRFLSFALGVAGAVALLRVASEADLRIALAPDSTIDAVHLESMISLSSTLIIQRSNVVLTAEHSAGLLLNTSQPTACTLELRHASNVTLSGLRITRVRHRPTPFTLSDVTTSVALFASHSHHLDLNSLTLAGGVTLHRTQHASVSWSDITNDAGTCVNISSCGDAATLTPCHTTLHDNLIHDCRADGGSPYSPPAQGVLLGGPEGGSQCTVGVVVRNNNVSDVDEMAVRVGNDDYAPCVLNEVYLNKIERWGQLPASDGGDTTDSGALYVYGHWFSPGNNVSFNLVLCSNSSWGNNGVYLDDASTGQIATGNIVVNCSKGSMIKLNGGGYNLFDSNLAVNGTALGFGNCRGLRGTPPQRYTCENQQRWIQVLEDAGYLNATWHAVWPWYTGWCTNTTAGPNSAPCAPPGAPSDYECAVLSRGNTVRNVAGVWVSPNANFTLQSQPGFPDNGTGICPDFVVAEQFNDVDWAASIRTYSSDQFVDASAGDWTLRNDSDVYADMPSFIRVPFSQIGIGGSGRRP